MKVYQQLWTTSEVWQVQAWYETYLLLSFVFGFLLALSVHLRDMALVRIRYFALLRGFARRGRLSFVSDALKSKLFFSKSLVAKYWPTHRFLLLLLFFLFHPWWLWVENGSWARCINLAIPRVFELNNFASVWVPLILGDVDYLTNEAGRCIAWSRSWE